MSKETYRTRVCFQPIYNGSMPKINKSRNIAHCQPLKINGRNPFNKLTREQNMVVSSYVQDDRQHPDDVSISVTIVGMTEKNNL